MIIIICSILVVTAFVLPVILTNNDYFKIKKGDKVNEMILFSNPDDNQLLKYVNTTQKSILLSGEKYPDATVKYILQALIEDTSLYKEKSIINFDSSAKLKLIAQP
jgi:hypothetical protein